MDDTRLMIHPTAIIESGATLGEGVSVGPYAYIGASVTIGAGSIVHHHATVDGLTVVGEGNEIFPYAYIGAKTHDLKYKGGESRLIIGARNVFREYVSIHLATNEGDATVLGSDNHFLAYAHVAHDCHVGNYCVMSSHAALGGHVVMHDHVVIGWDAGVHQFCKIGSYVMVGACSKLVQDVPPYMMVDGNPAVVRTINRVGLERRGFDSSSIERIRSAYKLLYRSGLNRAQALERILSELDYDSPEIQAILAFSSNSQRGFA
jgi:UDP-N-acetylglucosamine acyltransferase